MTFHNEYVMVTRGKESHYIHIKRDIVIIIECANVKTVQVNGISLAKELFSSQNLAAVIGIRKFCNY